MWLVLLALASGARAHDLGLLELRLTERAAGRYEVAVTAGGRFAAPVLPAECRWDEAAPARTRPSETVFGFACSRGLVAGDVLLLPSPLDGAVVTARWAGGETATRFFPHRSGAIPVAIGELGAAAAPPSALAWAGLGVEHILGGLDHLLFVAALVLLVRGAGPLLRTITAFTLAHSLTLGLATLGWVRLPAAPVEALIAASIALVAAEAVRGDADSRPWRMAFAFGLLHGAGFAGALEELRVPAGEVPLALLCFNLGVEAGQLAFIAALLPLVALARARGPWPSWLRAAPAYAIGVVAMVWFIQRVGVVIGA